MAIGTAIGGWSRRSQERAVLNARDASTALNRRRVEREEVELYLRSRAAAPTPLGVRRPA
jgi:hypothetical protein